MRIIEKNIGCPSPDKTAGCWGPIGPYYTVFGTELRLLTFHIITSAFVGLVLFVVLFVLNKKNKISLSPYMAILISLVSAILLFFVSAYFSPVMIEY